MPHTFLKSACRLRAPHWTLVTFCYLVLAGVVLGQGKGALRGTVEDSSGQMIVGANVKLHNQTDSQEFSTNSDEEGYFQFLGLPASQYILTKIRPGFKTRELPVNIQDRSDNQIHIKLQVAAEVESVRVSANDITMPVASQNMDSVELDRRWIENLPSKEADPLAVPSLFLSPAAGTMSPTCWRPRAGYNSLCEVVPLKKKALVVPRLGPRAEQRMRAELFQQKGLIDVLDPQEVSPRNLAQRIVDDLERTDLPIANAAIDMSGARNAARRLSGLVLERASLQPMTVSASQTVGGLSAKRAASG